MRRLNCFKNVILFGTILMSSAGYGAFVCKVSEVGVKRPDVPQKFEAEGTNEQEATEKVMQWT
jgi:hypothetical protein